MSMKQIKVSEATDAALDWLVAKCYGGSIQTTEHGVFLNQGEGYEYFTPSSSWTQGGPIIADKRISTISDCQEIEDGWLAESYDGESRSFGSTPLIAAMRCFCCSKLGELVEVPEELL